MFRLFAIFLFVCALGVCAPRSAHAQALPGAIDPGRQIADPEQLLPPATQRPDLLLSGPEVPFEAPEGTQDIVFTLTAIRIEGASALSQEELSAIYAPALGQTVPLSTLWEIAARITQAYREQGFFLSRAYVPAQDITDGRVTIAVVEGYISHVEVEGPLAQHRVVRQLAARMTDQRPARISVVESTMLRLDDIPGARFAGILSPDAQGAEGAVHLTLQQTDDKGRGAVSFDNNGSRYTGPQQISAAYATSLMPLQSTSVAALMTIPDTQESRSITLTHEARIGPEISLKTDISGSHTAPGYDLADFDIRGSSATWTGKVHWQAVRSRIHNLALEGGLYIRNSNTDILGTPSTRDRIRALQATAHYQGIDPWGGTNLVNATLTQGVEGLGANSPDEALTSREAAQPDFTTLKASWRRQDFVTKDVLMTSFVTGQKASKPLYSSEEFGFGGAYLGRAYDESEILGDDGVAGSVEVAWTGAPQWRGVTLTPSVFYEVGRVWNQDPDQLPRQSAADIGLGLDARYRNISASLSIAQPLTKPADTPLRGENGKSPRIMFNIQIPI
jgi:hemolysin activation/secretion protein